MKSNPIVVWVPVTTACSWVVARGDGFQIWKVAVNIIEKAVMDGLLESIRGREFLTISFSRHLLHRVGYEIKSDIIKIKW
jgi:hypothetical protein